MMLSPTKSPDLSYSPVLLKRQLHRRGCTDGGSADSKLRRLHGSTSAAFPKRRLSFGASKMHRRGIGSFFASDTEAALSDNINEFASSGRHRKTMLVSPSNRVISVNTQNSPTSGGKNLFGRRKFSLENRSSKNEDSLAEGNSQDHIKVCVRIRPMVPSEVEHSEVPAWTWDVNTLAPSSSARPYFQRTHSQFQSNGQAVENSLLPSYKFDHLFHPEHNNQQIFSSVVHSVVAAAMKGYHGSVFSYGQTSSGKTFTMNGGPTQPGIIPLAIQCCFDAVNTFPDKEFLLRVSYLEVHNEQVNDLLLSRDPGEGSPPHREAREIKIQHDPKLGTVVSGAREQVVNSPEQVFELLHAGESNRHVAATDMNDQSSRAHTLFKIIIESKDRTKAFKAQVSTLNLVDLAGSECAKMTNSRGDRAREGRHINQSLLTLSTIIQRLSEDNSKQLAVAGGSTIRRQHLPFRDSKLTRLLESALDGNAHIAIICTVSPSLRCVEESINTLKFAGRAKLIKMHARINEVVDDKTLLKSYKQEIAQLKQKLQELESHHRRLGSLPEAAAQQLASSAPDHDAGLDSGEPKEEFMAEIIAEMEKLILRADGSKGFIAKSSSLVLSRMSSIDTKLKDSIKYDFDEDELALSLDDSQCAPTRSLSFGGLSLQSAPNWPRLSGGSPLRGAAEDAPLLTSPPHCKTASAKLRPPRASELMHQEEDSVLFGVTKILSILKDAVAKSKSKNMSLKSFSPKNDENADFNKWGYSHNAVEQLISISRSMDDVDGPGGIGSIAQAQFERLKLDLQLKDADNRFLQDELDQKDRVMSVLTEGLKEVEQIQVQWLATNQQLTKDLQKAVGENEGLQQQLRALREALADKDRHLPHHRKAAASAATTQTEGPNASALGFSQFKCAVCNLRASTGSLSLSPTQLKNPPATSPPPAPSSAPAANPSNPSLCTNSCSGLDSPGSVSVQNLRRNFSDPKQAEAAVSRPRYSLTSSHHLPAVPEDHPSSSSSQLHDPNPNRRLSTTASAAASTQPNPNPKPNRRLSDTAPATQSNPNSNPNRRLSDTTSTAESTQPNPNSNPNRRLSETSNPNPNLKLSKTVSFELTPSAPSPHCSPSPSSPPSPLSPSSPNVSYTVDRSSPAFPLFFDSSSSSPSQLRAPSADDLTKTYPAKQSFDMADSGLLVGAGGQGVSRSSSSSNPSHNPSSSSSGFRGGDLFKALGLLQTKSSSSSADASSSSSSNSVRHLQQLSSAIHGAQAGRTPLVTSLLARRSSSFGSGRTRAGPPPESAATAPGRDTEAADRPPPSEQLQGSSSSALDPSPPSLPTPTPSARPSSSPSSSSSSSSSSSLSSSVPLALTAPRPRKGPMLKQAHSGLGLLKHWQQRHFLLDCGVLAYFDSAAALAAHCDGQAAVGGKGLLSKGKEGIPLRGHEVLLREGRSVISLVKDGKQVLQLDVKADAERRDWVAALKEHALFLSVQQ